MKYWVCLVVLLMLAFCPEYGISQTNNPNGPNMDKSAIKEFDFKRTFLTVGVNYIDNNSTNNISFYDDNFNRFKSAFSFGLSREFGQDAQIALDLHTNHIEVLGKDRFLMQSILLYNYDVIPLLFGAEKFLKIIAGAGVGYYHLQKEKSNMLLVYNNGLEIRIAKGVGIMVQHRGNIVVFNDSRGRVNNFNQIVFGWVTRL